MTTETTETPQEPSQALTAPTETPTLSLADVMTPEAVEALVAAGLSPELLRAPKPPEVTMTAFEALTTEETRYPKARKQTRPLVYLEHRVDLDSPAPKGYSGNLYISVVEPKLGPMVVKTGYARENGELMPVSEWVTTRLTKGDVFVVADIATAQGNTVYRPINPTAWAV